jgi:uncharacterized protein
MTVTTLARFAAAAAIAIGIGLVPARAQEPSRAAINAAREVIIAKGGAAMFNPLVRGVIESVKASFLPTNPNLGRDLNEVAVVIDKEFDGKRGELLNEVAKVYARHFTEQELKDLVVFYKTPLGQKWAREEPIAIDEGLRRAKDWTDQFSDVVMTKFREEMRKRGKDL